MRWQLAKPFGVCLFGVCLHIKHTIKQTNAEQTLGKSIQSSHHFLFYYKIVVAHSPSREQFSHNSASDPVCRSISSSIHLYSYSNHSVLRLSFVFSEIPCQCHPRFLYIHSATILSYSPLSSLRLTSSHPHKQNHRCVLSAFLADTFLR